MNLTFIKRRISTGVMFVLPFMALFVVIEKFWLRFKGLSDKIENLVGEKEFLGPYTTTILVILIFLLLFYVVGYFAHVRFMAKIQQDIESSFLQFIPGYLAYKNRMSEKLHLNEGTQQTGSIPVYILENNEKTPAVIIEKNDHEAVVFIPSIPDTNNGKLVVVPTDVLESIPMDYPQFIKSLQNSGKGLLA